LNASLASTQGKRQVDSSLSENFSHKIFVKKFQQCLTAEQSFSGRKFPKRKALIQAYGLTPVYCITHFFQFQSRRSQVFLAYPTLEIPLMGLMEEC